MQKNNKTVLIAKNLSDVLYHLKSVEGLQILAGCTNISEMSDKAVSIRTISELRSIEKHERSIDFGSCLTLTEILELGRTNMPAVLYDAIKSIGTFPLRNMATLGGNICSKGIKHSLWAPLLALDARLEFKSSSETKIIPMGNFKEVPKGFVLTKVKVPVDDWEVQIFRRTGPSNSLTNQSAGFAFLVDTQKDIIANVRITFAGSVIFRSRDLENTIIGTRLPLSDIFIKNLTTQAKEKFEKEFEQYNVPEIIKNQFLSLLRNALEQLT